MVALEQASIFDHLKSQSIRCLVWEYTNHLQYYIHYITVQGLTIYR